MYKQAELEQQAKMASTAAELSTATTTVLSTTTGSGHRSVPSMLDSFKDKDRQPTKSIKQLNARSRSLQQQATNRNRSINMILNLHGRQPTSKLHWLRQLGAQVSLLILMLCCLNQTNCHFQNAEHQLTSSSLLLQQNELTLQQIPAQAPPNYSSGAIQQQQQASKQQQEILVQPYSPVRIECKLPPFSTSVTNGSSKKFYWNFQSSASQNQKPDLLCFQQTCIDESSYGIQLEINQESGAYDLIISNATYELNDGIYYCVYRDTSPESRTTINREIRLTVLIPPQPPVLTAPSVQAAAAAGQQIVAREGQEFSLQCTSFGGNPEPNITWTRNDVPIVASSSGSSGPRIEQTRHISNATNTATGTTTSSLLTWIPTLDDHQATYKCLLSNKAMQQQPAYERELTLAVEYAPRISVGPVNPLRLLQGERATLSCQVDANPPVKGIRWLRDGRVVSSQFNFTLPDGLKISDAGTYSCQADNGITPTLAYLASSAASNSAGAGSMGSSSSSILNFFGLSSSSSSQQQQQQQQQSPSDKTTVEARLQLEVLYGPRVHLRELRSMPLNEADFFSLNCSVDSWPPAHEFIWTKQEQHTDGQYITRRLSQTNNSPTLEFNHITASDMGNYTCTAINRMEPSAVGNNNMGGQLIERQGSASFMVLVRHKPGLAEITAGQNGETELGNRTLIQCRANPPGYPEPQYKFWRYQPNVSGQMTKFHLNKQSNEPVYQIHSAKAEDEGKYGCMAFNEISQSTDASTDLVVNEAPSIIVEQTRPDEDSRSPGEYPYSITVRASGKPEPRVVWYHRSPIDGRRIELSSAEMMSHFKIETLSNKVPASTSHGQSVRPKYMVVSTLSFKRPLDVDDRGLYTVEFSNGLSRVATWNRQLHISHAPIPMAAHQRTIGLSSASPNFYGSNLRNNATSNALSADTHVKAGFEIGETANLICRVSAYPKPSFVWYGVDKDGSQIDSNPRYRNTVVNTHDDVWEGSLSFEVSSESDYVQYLCATANEHPQSHSLSETTKIFINLVHKSKPEAPQQFEQVDASQDSITLQWLPGFDGGLASTRYIVQFSPDTEQQQTMSQSLLSRFTGGSNDISSQNPMPTSIGLASGQVATTTSEHDCFTVNPCTITQLSQRQAYVMRVYAKNSLGESEPSEQIRAFTSSNDSQSMPRIQEATFEQSHNLLQIRLEPNHPEFLLNNLNVRIEARVTGQLAAGQSNEQQQQLASSAQNTLLEQDMTQQSEQWRYHSTLPIRFEQRGSAVVALSTHLDSTQIEQLKLTLCSRSQENLCGPEYLFGLRSNASPSLVEQVRGLSWPFVLICLASICAFAFLATSLNSCSLSRARKAKKVAAAVADAVDHHHHHHHHQRPANGVDNKYGSTPGQPIANGSHKGSTTSTNSTNVVTNNQLSSMDLLANGQPVATGFGAGNGSDHSSDHSRQAKLDSMVPPNYSYYADRASLMLEQQQQQQALYQQQASDKLNSPFGLPSNGLFGQQVIDPFGHYGSTGQHQQFDQQQQQQLDAQSMVLNSMLASSGPLDPTGNGIQDASMWATSMGQPMDDYNSYNNYANQTAQQQMIESAYGTTGSGGSAQNNAIIMAQQSANFDNSANQQAYQQHASDNMSSSYHQEIQAAQQQMYGTLTRQQSNQFNATRSSYNGQTAGNESSLLASEHPLTDDIMDQQSSHQQQGQQQQQAQNDSAYMSTNGLMPPPPPPPPQESDYGTTGSRASGRLIREIIV